jgi:hypothetical protein
MKHLPAIDTSLFFRTVTQAIFEEVKPVPIYVSFVNWYKVQDEKARYSILEKVYQTVHDGRHPEVLQRYGLDKTLEDISAPESLLILSYCVVEMKKVPCRDERSFMDVRKARYRDMAAYLEKTLKGHYKFDEFKIDTEPQNTNFNLMMR